MNREKQVNDFLDMRNKVKHSKACLTITDQIIEVLASDKSDQEVSEFMRTAADLLKEERAKERAEDWRLIRQDLKQFGIDMLYCVLAAMAGYGIAQLAP